MSKVPIFQKYIKSQTFYSLLLVFWLWCFVFVVYFFLSASLSFGNIFAQVYFFKDLVHAFVRGGNKMLLSWVFCLFFVLLMRMSVCNLRMIETLLCKVFKGLCRDGSSFSDIQLFKF